MLFASVKALLRMFPISNSGQVVLAEARLTRVAAGARPARLGVQRGLTLDAPADAVPLAPPGRARWGGNRPSDHARPARPAWACARRCGPGIHHDTVRTAGGSGPAGARRVVCCASFPLLRPLALRYAPFSRTSEGEGAQQREKGVADAGSPGEFPGARRGGTAELLRRVALAHRAGEARPQWYGWGFWDDSGRAVVQICCKDVPGRNRRREEPRNTNDSLPSLRRDPGLCNRFGQPPARTRPMT